MTRECQTACCHSIILKQGTDVNSEHYCIMISLKMWMMSIRYGGAVAYTLKHSNMVQYTLKHSGMIN